MPPACGADQHRVEWKLRQATPQKDTGEQNPNEAASQAAGHLAAAAAGSTPLAAAVAAANPAAISERHTQGVDGWVGKERTAAAAVVQCSMAQRWARYVTRGAQCVQAEVPPNLP